MPTCRACGEPVETWQQWWREDCTKSMWGHQLTREEWMKLPGYELGKNGSVEAEVGEYIYIAKEEV